MKNNEAAGKRNRLWLALAFIVVSLAALVAVYFGGRYFAECSSMSDTATSTRTATSFVNSLIQANDCSTTTFTVADGGTKLKVATYDDGATDPTIICVYFEDGHLYESISDPNSVGYPTSPAQVEELIACTTFNVSADNGMIVVTCEGVSNGWSPHAATVTEVTA